MPEPQSSSAGLPWLKAVFGVVFLGLGAWAFVHYDGRAVLQAILDEIAELGIWGPVLFILIYVIATVFLIPGSVLTLGAGAVFGVAKGSVVVSIAATLGATAAFLVGRYLARDWVAGKIEGNRTFSAIDKAVADDGWKIVGLTRLSPVFPFTMLNYAFGLTRVSLRDYFFATWIGMIPGTIMYVYLGALANAGLRSEGRTAGQWVMLVVGLVATIAVTVFVTLIAKKSLGKRIETS